MHFFRKNKETTCGCHYQNLDDMNYSSWDTEQNILKLVILGHILPFYPPKNQKKSKFWIMKKFAEISSFYTCVPKITIIWYMVPEIRSEADIIFCHFGPYFALLPPPPPNDPENQNIENAWRYYPFVHTCVP